MKRHRWTGMRGKGFYEVKGRGRKKQGVTAREENEHG